MASNPKPLSVIIIGAGISGIAAGKTLHEGGIREMVILEGTSRIGGRIHRQQFGGQIIELGANWLHHHHHHHHHHGHHHGPSCSSSVQQAANAINLRTVFSDYTNVSSHVYRQEGGLYDENEVKAAMKKAKEVLDFGVKLSESLQETQDDMSILALQRLCKRVPRSPLERMVDFYYYDYEDGEPPRVTSLKHTILRNEFIDFGDDQLFVVDPKGFESVVHHFAKMFLTHKKDVIIDPKLKLNQVVKEIIYTNRGVTVKIEGGVTYHAQAVIMSVSLGVLQNNLIQFNPKLPDWKERAIYEFSMTTFTKIFLKFPYKFWPTGPGTEFFFYVHERRGYYPIWKESESSMGRYESAYGFKLCILLMDPPSIE